MIRTGLRAGALALALMALTFGLCFWLNGRAPIVQNGIPAVPGAPAALTGWEWNGNEQFFDLNPTSGSQAALLYGALDGPLYGSGELLTGPVPYSQFSSLRLEGPVQLQRTTSGRSAVLYLADADIARQAIITYNTLFGLGLGVTALMGLYALSLYWHKRSEAYLAWFAAYAAMLTIWSLGSLSDGQAAAAFLTRNAYGWSALLNLFLCFRMFGLPLPGQRRGVPGWALALAVLALWCPLCAAIPAAVWDLTHAGLFLCSLFVLVWACAARRPGAWLALTGQALSQGLRMVIALNGLTGQTVGFSLRTMQYAKLFNLPFLLCGMWIISRKFAEQFTRSEQLSAQLETVNRGLEQQVEQRTRALREEQVQRVAFMANAFHDLRTPLFVVQGCLDRLESGAGTGGNLTGVMRDRLDFMRKLVEDMFLMAKLEEKQVIFDEDRVPLAPLAERVTDGLREAAVRQDVRLTLEVRDRCIAWGDDLRLEQALQNLVTNALHYTPPGGVVTVRLYAEGNEACLEVRDTGPGIPLDEQDKVFLRYYRSPRAKRQGSSGLGLSIARQIVLQHQGRITLDSRPGEGSAFTIRLPAVRRPGTE
ncbi:MAG TPA: sensor histidine kinase [Candidatus Gemmiger avium]|nr:sensor histidine kinase [Candidatus Gemmiger avium]